MILGRGADQRRAADVNVLDGILERRGGVGDGLLKRIEIDDDQVNRVDVRRGQGVEVCGQIPAGEDAGVDLGMQGLDPSTQDFRLTCIVGDLGDLQARGKERRPRASTGQQGHISLGQAAPPARSTRTCPRRSAGLVEQ